MSRARVARRIAAGAAYGGGSIGLLGAAGVGILLAEVQLAKRSVGIGDAPVPPNGDGWYGLGYGHTEPLRMAMLGDSLAAGQGVRRTGQTPGHSWPRGSPRSPSGPWTCGTWRCPAPGPTIWTAR